MADKNLKVLAECIDTRTGRRFQPGETFDPVPTGAQARRLIAAGCLPKGAQALADQADDDAETKAEQDAVDAAQKASNDDARMAAEATAATARDALTRAQAKVAAATADADKGAAQAELDAAQKAVNEADAALAPFKQDPAAVARDQLNDDKLFDNTVEQLKALAAAENVDLGKATAKADIVAAIRAGRAAKAA